MLYITIILIHRYIYFLKMLLFYGYSSIWNFNFERSTHHSVLHTKPQFLQNSALKYPMSLPDAKGARFVNVKCAIFMDKHEAFFWWCFSWIWGPKINQILTKKITHTQLNTSQVIIYILFSYLLSMCLKYG